MQPLLVFTLGGFVAAGLPESLPAQHALGAELTQVGSHGKKPAPAIPFEQIGSTAENHYSGNGLSVCAVDGGAHLRCAFQRLQGEATSEGMWLTSIVTNTVNDRFRVMATGLGRSTSKDYVLRAASELPPGFALRQSIGAFAPSTPRKRHTTAGIQGGAALPPTGTVAVANKVARFIRSGVIEEYSVSMDGVRQDFVIETKPEGEGELRVELAVTGATAEPLANGARLVLDGSGRNIAYNRLRVTDVNGKELPAYIEVVALHPDRSRSDTQTLDAPALAILVNDTSAVYPVRIDPTFSDDNWVSMGGIPGISGTVFAVAADDSANVYVGGYFSIAGDVFATNIAKWDGSRWSSLGSGLNGSVYALAVSSNDVYAGGFFTTAGGAPASCIAKWNGSTWSSLASGTSDAVYALAVSGSNLYAGGFFKRAGSVAATNIAKWNGSTWSGLGSGMSPGSPIVYALAISGNDLYAGGSFTKAGGTAATNIAMWDGTNWSALGVGMGGGSFPVVRALAVSGNNLYAGGDFTSAGGTLAKYVAKWDGSGWSGLGAGASSKVYALTGCDNHLYAGGSFSGIVKWDGSNWSALVPGVQYPGDFVKVNALSVAGTELYVGGDFSMAGDIAARHIAKWNGTWSALGSGIDGSPDAFPYVSAAASSGSELYIGGEFLTAGGITVNYVARWDGSNWSALGSGVTGGDDAYPAVHALTVSGSDLYAGGIFTNAGGITAKNIAKWDGNRWSALGSGLNNTVRALAVSGSDLYAGGFFTVAGGVTVNCIARWNGTNWSALGSGMDNVVWALATWGNDLYAAGGFTTANGFPASRIAKWNGNSWSSVGSGIDNPSGSTDVFALAASPNGLYATGHFTAAGGVPVNYIAKWDGSRWSPLGSGLGGTCINGCPYGYALTVSDDFLYAGGLFRTAGDVMATNIAKWNGSAWSSLGSGVIDRVNALAVSRQKLYVGGQFLMAGGKISVRMAQVRVGNIAKAVTLSNSTAFVEFCGVTGYQYHVQRTISLDPPVTWTTVTTSPLSPTPDGSFTFSDTNAPPGMAYYRAVEH